MATKSNEIVAVSQQYDTKLNEFVKFVTETTGESFSSSAGRKYDKVFRFDEKENKCAFMVVRSTGEIFGTKSWVMINYRRAFGTLDTIREWVWSYPKRPQPVSGTDSFIRNADREAGIASKYAPRGRPRKNLSVV